MARFTALTLLAFCLAMAAAQQQPPRLRGNDWTLQMTAAAAAAAAEPNKKAAAAPQGAKAAVTSQPDPTWTPMRGEDFTLAEGEGDKLTKAVIDTNQPDMTPMRSNDFTLAEGEGDKQLGKGNKQFGIIDAIEHPANGAKPGEPTS